MIDKKEDFELAGFVLWMARTRAIPLPSPVYSMLPSTSIFLGIYGGEGTVHAGTTTVKLITFPRF